MLCATTQDDGISSSFIICPSGLSDTSDGTRMFGTREEDVVEGFNRFDLEVDTSSLSIFQK